MSNSSSVTSLANSKPHIAKKIVKGNKVSTATINPLKNNLYKKVDIIFIRV